MGVKLAAAMGAEVTVFSTSKSKVRPMPNGLSAAHFAFSSDSAAMSSLKERFDLLISTISAQYDVNVYLQLLKVDGTMVLVGVPPKALGLLKRTI